ncbi:hypothetical protein [Schlesneria sp. T3-172]|uniref:hypothetical protein n=1 Tax=Schlesneria sphaerica TaxID=3373610 RepID=UPI0037C4F31B
MNAKQITLATLAAALLAIPLPAAIAQDFLNGQSYGTGYYTGSGQGYYGGYGQGYGAYGSGYSSEFAPGYPTLSQQNYVPYRDDIAPVRSYNSFGSGRYGATRPNSIFQNSYNQGYGFGTGYDYGYGFGGGGPGLSYGGHHQRIDGFGGSGDHYYRKGSPYSRF